MDKTDLFKAEIKTIRLRLRTQQKEIGSLNDALFSKQSGRKSSEFAKLAKETNSHITLLKQFLLKHRREYIDSIGHLSPEFSQMNDKDRDMIDKETQHFIKICSEHITGLQSTLSVDNGSLEEQCKQHRNAVLESLQVYLKDVCKLYSEQKAIRVKRVVDKKRTSRLQPEGKKISRSTGLHPGLDCELKPGLGFSLEDQNANNGVVALSEQHRNKSEENRNRLTDEITDSHPSGRTDPDTDRLPVLVPVDDFSYKDTFSSDEIATFQQENAIILDHMTSLVDEVRHIEGKVVEISHLQEIFAEKVLEQAEQLDVIHDSTVTATENVKEGNEQIRSAIRNQGSFRMWILFILVVCSFTLLFLDWYS